MKDDILNIKISSKIVGLRKAIKKYILINYYDQ